MKADRARQIAQELQLARSSQMRVRFHGQSMQPLLRDGDRVIVEPVGWDDIRPGDLITYRCEDRFPTRRVVRKRASTLLLWCDNWPHDRFQASRAQVLGRAVARERHGVWLDCRDSEWRAAGRRGLAKFRRLHLRRAFGRLRDAMRRLLRRGGNGDGRPR